ncbi:hypothetical protein [Bradyrhizobium sp. CCBAU 51745]|uniref:hypothetical protein n=1 Tax=Bradyrhizobium sp. CCBAU 51745 TaxID=1325099 RepID=UPI0023055A91|nr:hypothetical protein [Bradyrhizobium sp. CCBAU 51745]
MSQLPCPEPRAKAMPNDPAEEAFTLTFLLRTTIRCEAPCDTTALPGKPERDPKMAEFARQAHGWESASGDLCHRSSGQVSSEHLNRMLNEHHSYGGCVTSSSNRHANAG